MSVLVRKISEILTLDPAFRKGSRQINESDLGIHQNWAMLIDRGRISWLGPEKKIPKKLTQSKSLKEMSAVGKTILPGFVECHTHSVFAGHRAEEFEKRLSGVSYSEIASQGGGILSTMRKTRAISPEQLRRQTQMIVNRFIRQGVTTLEIKSGYALDLKNEIKQLQVARQMKGPRILTSFLGAHAKPPEYESYESYLNDLATKYLPQIKKKKLSERVDIFIEKGFFPLEASKKYLEVAQALGFQVVIHADQLSLSGGSELAVSLSALSADHLIQVQEKQIKRLANSEVTCVLLPAADLYLQCDYPPARALIDSGARVALATDFNPGSSPTQDLCMVGLLARLEMKMTLPEVISAYTVGASYALGLAKEIGSLSLGKTADFLVTEKSWSELFYSVGDMGIEQTFRKGRKLNAAL